ncbi:MAG: hypothetical protein HY560_03620 [Gemmatimonadetes bacterium]|nr:hypothetical protein [Gemmatimonadota bacterium]
MYSLRRVLAARFSLTMFVALALIAFWAFMGTEHVLQEQLGKSLRSALDLTTASLGRGGMIPVALEARDTDRFVSEVNRFIAARDSSGRIVQGNTAQAFDLPLDTASFRLALAGEPQWSTDDWRGHRVRSLYAGAPRTPHPGIAVLQVAASLTPLAEDNRRVLFLLFGTVVLGTLATLFGAWWLARSAVAPVLEVADQARVIAPETQGKRITAHADVAEYAMLVEVLNDVLARCERAFQTQRRFIGDVSHELRTPVTALQGQIEVALRAERSPRDYQRVLQGALEETTQLARMCDSLLLITRAEGQALTLHRAPTDLSTVTGQLLDAVRPRITDQGLAVDLRLRGDARPAMVDEQLISRALEQLVDNAVKFSPPGGRLVIGADPIPGGVRWWIEDSGPGIAPDELPRLFEPFYRVDPARSRDSGSGLGLALAASITRLHGGTIRAAHAPTGGARFEVELPAGPE